MTRRTGLLALLLLAVGAAPSTAAAATVDRPDPGTTRRLTLGSGATAHPYIVYVPSTYRAARAAPLVVMAHGCQTTAAQQMRATRFNRVAERAGIVMLYPDVDAREAAQPGPLARCWRFFDPRSWHRGSGDAAAIAGMTRRVMARWHVDRRRVYMVGMSAGSFMTSIMAAAYPDVYAAVAIMAGGAYADSGCLLGAPGMPVRTSARLARREMGRRARVVPRMVMGGDADRGISPACADKALAQGLRTDNLVLGPRQTRPISLAPSSVRTVPKPGGHRSTVRTYRDPAGCVIGERWLIHGMDHFWSGGSRDPALASFTDPRGPNGAVHTWRFLSRFTRRPAGVPRRHSRRPCR